MPHGLNLGMRDETSTGSCWCDSYQKKSGAVPGSQGLVFRSHILHTFWRWRRFIKKHWHRWLPPPQICTHCRSRQNWIQLRYDIYIYCGIYSSTGIQVEYSRTSMHRSIPRVHIPWAFQPSRARWPPEMVEPPVQVPACFCDVIFIMCPEMVFKHHRKSST